MGVAVPRPLQQTVLRLLGRRLLLRWWLLGWSLLLSRLLLIRLLRCRRIVRRSCRSPRLRSIGLWRWRLRCRSLLRRNLWLGRRLLRFGNTLEHRTAAAFDGLINV